MAHVCQEIFLICSLHKAGIELRELIDSRIQFSIYMLNLCLCFSQVPQHSIKRIR